jgi:hypothetical protein
MTPTLPDGWTPPKYTPSAEEKDRVDTKEIFEPTPVRLVRVAKFYFKNEGKK